MDTIGARIKYLRKKHKISQEAVAKGAGVQRGNISHYERGDWNPNFDTTKKIAAFFNVDVNWLFYGQSDIYDDVNVPYLRSENIDCVKERESSYCVTPKEEVQDYIHYATAIGKKITYIRSDIGMSPKDFAEAISITLESLANYESGKSPIPAYVLYKISEIFNILPKFLLVPNESIDREYEVAEDHEQDKPTYQDISHFFTKLSSDDQEEITKLITWKYEKSSKKGTSSKLESGKHEQAAAKEKNLA